MKRPGGIIGDLIDIAFGDDDNQEPDAGALAPFMERGIHHACERFPKSRELFMETRTKLLELRAIENPIERRREEMKWRMELRQRKRKVDKRGQCPRCADTGWLIELRVPPWAKGDVLFGYETAVPCACREQVPIDPREPSAGRTRTIKGPQRKKIRSWKDAAAGERPEDTIIDAADRAWERAQDEDPPGGSDA